jgi:hypothetical protein
MNSALIYRFHIGQEHTQFRARPSQSIHFSLQKAFSFISYPGGWTQMIPQVKKPDVEVVVTCGLQLGSWLELQTNSLEVRVGLW